MRRNKKRMLRILTLLLGAMLMTGGPGSASFAYDQTRITTWEQLQSAFSSGGSFTMGRSVTAGEDDGPLTVPAGVTVTLDLNGMNIDRGLGSAEARPDGCVMINNGTLIIRDPGSGVKGRITGGNNSGDGGGIDNQGTLILENGNITGNKAGKSGGGIHNTGTLTMTGGNIWNNTAVGFHGGGIYNSGTLTLSGGQIQKNEVLGEESKGQGGGILQNGTMNVSGAPIVKENKAKQGSNIYLRSDHPTMNVTGAFTRGAFLRVSRAGGTGVITSGYSMHHGKNDDPQVIFVSDEGYLIRLIDGEAKIVSGASLLRYYERSWNGSEVVRDYIETDQYKLMSDVKDSGSTLLQTGTYVAQGNISFSNRIGVASGAEVTLILCDSSKLTMKKGIHVNGRQSSLKIYGQTYDSGILEAKAGSDAPIGADSKTECGTIEIHGGHVIATTKGENPSAAIGGGKKCPASGKVTIYGGWVEADSKYSGAGIGSGEEGSSPAITIYGGTVDAEAADGAAIGAGCTYKTTNQDYGGYGPIKIYGGVVNAEASGSGIGAGNNNKNPRIEIYGGEISAICRANGESGAGIGAGRYADQSRPVMIYGGRVIAISEGGAGVGAGARYDGGNITIEGGTVAATSTNGGAGIGGGRRGGDGGHVLIKNGRVIAAALKTSEGADIQRRFNEMAIAFEGGGHTNKGLTGAMLFQTIGNIIRATSGDECGAGIGAGYDGDGGVVEITGGYVVASASTGKARAIGHGTSSSKDGTLSLYKGAAVYSGKDEDSASYMTHDKREAACRGNRYALILPCLHENSTCNVTEEKHQIICRYCEQLSGAWEPHEWDENGQCRICGYRAAPAEYTIRFDSGGGSGSMQPVTKKEGEEYELPSCDFTPPEGQSFDQWLLTAGEDIPVLKKPGQMITVTDDISVKALWKELNADAYDTEEGTESANGPGTSKNVTVSMKEDDATEGSKAVIALKVTQKDAAYGEELKNPVYTYTDRKGDHITIPKGCTLSISYSGSGYGPSPAKPTDAGKYTVSVTAETDTTVYTGTADFTIKRKKVTVTAENEYKCYGDADPVPEARVSVDGKSDSTVNVSYTLSRVPGEKVGKYEIVPSGDPIQGNYKVSYVPGTLTISRADADGLGLEATGFEGAYDAKFHTVVASVALTKGTTIEYSTDDGETWSTKAPRIREADYDETVVLVRAVNRNYRTAMESVILNVVPKEVIVRADDKTKICGEKDPALTASVDGLIGSDTVSYTLSRIPGEKAGKYEIMPSGAVMQGNYAVSYMPGTLTIAPEE